MTYSELFEIKEGIVVLAGEYSPLAQREVVGIVPEVDFRTYRPGVRGIIAYPEGYSRSFMDVVTYSNHPVNLIKNCEELVKSGWEGVILTNSHFVVDAIDTFSKKYKTTTRFFLSDAKGKVEDCTNELARIYKSFCWAIDFLNEIKDELEDEDE